MVIITLFVCVIQSVVDIWVVFWQETFHSAVKVHPIYPTAAPPLYYLSIDVISVHTSKLWQTHNQTHSLATFKGDGNETKTVP